ncbi:MAG: hypothetical protein M1813_009014 [Trichoglossum hirsutum]|nr:MAG: hypothetical protein M1813_009014 [Trichoglossum hirsutum]
MATKSLNVTLNPDASLDELEKAKNEAKAQGGKITNEFKLIKGFTVEFPADTVQTLATNKHITVENDGKVTTQ